MPAGDDEDLAEFKRVWPHIQAYQMLAEKHGIKDIFQDNGGKILQVLLLLGLTNLAGREGNDAVDKEGREFELKSANLELVTGISTHHHLNPTILAKYRTVDWVIALYRNIELQAVYKLTPGQLEPLFSRWEGEWQEKGDRNNPKIPIKLVVEVGELLYGTHQSVREIAVKRREARRKLHD